MVHGWVTRKYHPRVNDRREDAEYEFPSEYIRSRSELISLCKCCYFVFLRVVPLTFERFTRVIIFFSLRFFSRAKILEIFNARSFSDSFVTSRVCRRLRAKEQLDTEINCPTAKDCRWQERSDSMGTKRAHLCRRSRVPVLDRADLSGRRRKGHRTPLLNEL